MIKIASYISPKLTCFLSVTTRDQAIEALIDAAFKQKKIKDKETFFRAILEREKVVSTGIGMGVALPHAKLPELNEFFVVIGILQKGIEWNAIDGAPVRLIFLIGGPNNKPTEYLQILSALTLKIKDEEPRKKMLTCNSADVIMNLLRSSD